MSLVVLLSVGLAILSWRYVERPFRSRSRIAMRPLFAGAAAGMAVLVIAGGAVAVAQGWPGRFPLQVQTIAAATAATDPRAPECRNVLFGGGSTAPAPSLFGAEAPPPHTPRG